MGSDTMKPASRNRLDPMVFACGGSLVGMVLFALYDTCTISPDTVADDSDFATFFAGMAVFVAGGASMLAVAAGLWNRRTRSSSSETLPVEWIRQPSREEAGHFNDVIISIRCPAPTAQAERASRWRTRASRNSSLPAKIRPECQLRTGTPDSPYDRKIPSSDS